MSDSLCSLRELYALGGLTDSEQNAFEAHLQTCLECQHELNEFETVTEALLFDFDPVSPATGMRDRVLDHVLNTPQETSSELKQTSHNVSDDDSEGSGTHSIRDQASTRLTSRAWWTFSAAAAALVILASGVTYSVTPRSPGSPFGQFSQPISLNSKIPGAMAKMWVTHGQNTEKMVLHFNHLKPITNTQVYQVWLIKDSTSAPYSAGVFTPDGQGNAVFASIMPPGSYQVVAVTLEPKAIDPKPLGPIVFEAKT